MMLPQIPSYKPLKLSPSEEKVARDFVVYSAELLKAEHPLKPGKVAWLIPYRDEDTDELLGVLVTDDWQFVMKSLTLCQACSPRASCVKVDAKRSSFILALAGRAHPRPWPPPQWRLIEPRQC